MRRTSIFSAIAIASLCLASCQDLGELSTDIPMLDSDSSITISDGQTLNLDVMYVNMSDDPVTGNVEWDNKDYSVSFAAGEGSKGTLTIAAPAYILDDTPFGITLKIEDESRVNERLITVKPVLSKLLVKTDAPANSYITNPGSILDFPTNLGNTSSAVAYDAFGVLWQDEAGLVADIISSGDGKAVVRFAEGKQGNVVFAAKKGDEIVWSWHVWVCSEAPKTFAWTDDNGKKFEVMDRNLGALGTTPGTTEVNGLMFQWGRKDPFPGSDNKNTRKAIYDGNGGKVETSFIQVTVENTFAEAVKNPLAHYGNSGGNGNYSWMTTNCLADDWKAGLAADLWGGASGKKGQNDPCPAGYKVAGTDALGFIIDTDYAKTRIFDPAVETPAAKNQWGMEIAIGDGVKTFFPSQGDCAPNNGSFEYGVGSTYPYLGFWTANFNPSFPDSKSYFQGMSIRTGANAAANATASYTKFSGLTLAYELPVRCVKE